MFGIEKNEWLNFGWRQVFEKVIVQEITSCFNDKEFTSNDFFITVANIEQTDIHMKVFLEKLVDINLNGDYYIASFEDITTVKALQDLMIQAEKMAVVGQIGASIAHEIRNPLTSIKGFLQLLQAGVQYKDEYYRIMALEIEKMEAITTELLVSAKPSNDKWREEEVLKMIRDVVLLLKSQARLKDITLKVELPINEKIYCNPSQIKQVLINLVKNAIEAMETAGEINIYVDRKDDEIHIYVRDEGVGISTEDANKLEELFFTTKEEGTGLGLNITKKILNAHKGSLRFSRNFDKGSTFEVILPKNM